MRRTETMTDDDETCVACGDGFDSAEELQEALEEEESSDPG